MRVFDETFMECPWYGGRWMARHLRPNHVWSANVNYIPMHRSFLYLVALMNYPSSSFQCQSIRSGLT